MTSTFSIRRQTPVSGSFCELEGFRFCNSKAGGMTNQERVEKQELSDGG
jgi:hypothetical protein